MLKLIAAYKSKKPKHKNIEFVGIELENELYKPFDHAFKISGWKIVAEASLRYNGYEFVSVKTPYADAEKSVQHLFQMLREHAPTGCKFTNSIRTSVHVHFDVTDYTPIGALRWAVLYWVLEPFLLGFCGKHRDDNLFCVNTKNSTYLAAIFSTAMKNGIDFMDSSVSEENFRYSSVNFNAIRKFGTLEFRAMRGVSTPEEMLTWLRALKEMKDFAKKFRSMKALNNYFIQTDFKNLPRMVFTKNTLKVLNDYAPDLWVENSRKAYLSVLPVLSAKIKKPPTLVKKPKQARGILSSVTEEPIQEEI